MAPKFGTGIGMTETGGFVTFHPAGHHIEEMAGRWVASSPTWGGLRSARPMNADGTAGEEFPDGEIGEICYTRRFVLQLGLLQPARSHSPDDLKGGPLLPATWAISSRCTRRRLARNRALYLPGGRKFVIKQSGYLVFPDEVERISPSTRRWDVADGGRRGARDLWRGHLRFRASPGGMALTANEVLEHCKKIASYKTPDLMSSCGRRQAFPAEAQRQGDKLEMARLAAEIAKDYGKKGEWDRSDKLTTETQSAQMLFYYGLVVSVSLWMKKIGSKQMIIYLIRHATPDWSRSDLAYHLPPGPPLVERGARKAGCAGDFLRGQASEAVHQPLERCQVTAEIRRCGRLSCGGRWRGG